MCPRCGMLMVFSPTSGDGLLMNISLQGMISDHRTDTHVSCTIGIGYFLLVFSAQVGIYQLGLTSPQDSNTITKMNNLCTKKCNPLHS